MKKLLSLILIVAMLLSLSACAKGSDNATQNPPTTPTPTTTGVPSTTARVYAAGEKWIEEEWEFTINAVYVHEVCYSRDLEKYGPRPVVVIDYTYKNIGFVEAMGDYKLEFNTTAFEVYDANGFSAVKSLACTHCLNSKMCIVGTSCHAQAAFIMDSDADISKVIIAVDHYKNDIQTTYGEKNVVGSATYEVVVTNEDMVAEDDTVAATTRPQKTTPPTTITTTRKPVTEKPTRTTQTRHQHQYGEATCDQPATCSCGARQGRALGHSYSGKTCTRCGANNPTYMETFSLGETWVVDGEWEITFNAVYLHVPCNHYDPGQGFVVIVNYTYKNIGYELNGLDLSFHTDIRRAYDENGEAGDTYACTHRKDHHGCIIGTSCTAEEAYVFDEATTQITIAIDKYGTDKVKRYAKFVLDIF